MFLIDEDNVSGWIITNKRLSTAKRKVFSDISLTIRAIILSLDAGSITVACLMMLENVKKFWDSYDAFVKVCPQNVIRRLLDTVVKQRQ